MPVYEFGVQMSCSGCSGAVDRVLSRLEGVKSKNIDLDTQTVTVEADDSLAITQVEETIAKTGKKINYQKTVA